MAKLSEEPPDRSQIRKDLNDLIQNQLAENLEIMLEDATSTVVKADESAENYLQRDLNDKFPRLFELDILGKGVHKSGAAVLKLCREGDINSAYIVARALIERAVNFAYLTVCENEEFQAWRDYSYQKALRMLNREKQVGSFDARIEHLPSADLLNNPDLAPMFEPFTGKGGGEITRWSSRTLDQRLEYVEGKFDGSKHVVALLATELISAYEIGAEAQHGTFLGVEIRRGFLPPYKVEDDYHEVSLEYAVLATATATMRSLSNFANRPDWAEWVATNISPRFKEILLEGLTEHSVSLSDEEQSMINRIRARKT